MMTEKRFDLHMHSIYSDGEDTPSALVEKAAQAGLAMMAVSDHDTIQGVPEALLAGRATGIRVIPAVELDTECSAKVHMLGYGVDITAPCLTQYLDDTAKRRDERNEAILDKLAGLRMDVRALMRRGAGTTTRFDIALALVAGGYVNSAAEAFARYLEPGLPAYIKPNRRPTPVEAIALIKQAHGVPVLAHPCNLKGDPHPLIEQLVAGGLMGLEVYYPSSTPGQTALFRSLAEQYGLMQTTGSDYHGATRRNVALGYSWQNVPALSDSFQFFMEYSQN